MLIGAVAGCASPPARFGDFTRLDVYADIYHACHGTSLSWAGPNPAPPTPKPIRFKTETLDFASLRNQPATVADFERFIDPRITGSLRSDVLAIMERMKPSARRNFGFVLDGGVYSNNEERLEKTREFVVLARELGDKSYELVFWPDRKRPRECGGT